MEKEIPEKDWANFLMAVAVSNQGKKVALYLQIKDEEERKIGTMPLVAIEGDCRGDIVDGVKIVIGEMGDDNPDNLFHYVDDPQSIKAETTEMDELTTLILIDSKGDVTRLEFL